MKKKYLGMKYFGHDSGIFILDCNKKEFFGVLTEKYTRKKHDDQSIELLFEQLQLKEFDYYLNSTKDINLLYRHFDSQIKKIIESKRKYLYIKERENYFKSLKDSKLKLTLFLLSNIHKKEFSNILIILFNYIKIHSISNNSQKRLKNIDLSTNLIRKFLNIKNIENIDHQLTHACSAYYFSPHQGEKALVMTLDGLGDDYSFSSLWTFDGKSRELISTSSVTHKELFGSIGILYSEFTEILGFRKNSDEGKTEALAAYGKADKKLFNLLKSIYSYDKKALKLTYDSQKLKLLKKSELIKYRELVGDENFAATIQTFLEEYIVDYLSFVSTKYKLTKLCLAGGVFANVILNLHIFEKTKFKELYIFPAMGDDGTAAGAAICKAVDNGEDLSWIKDNQMPYWGPRVSQKELVQEIKKGEFSNKIIAQKMSDNEISKDIAKMIYDKKVVSLVSGNMEYGPRALGNRSIIANPTHQETRERINSNIKKRPYFQPFCPSVLEDERERLYEESFAHKHMATAFRLKKKYWKDLSSGIHIDGTSRPQFVTKKDNLLYYNIINEFKKLSGFGMIINTSFNLHGRTIVRTPNDSIRDFLDCDLDALYIENYKIQRK